MFYLKFVFFFENEKNCFIKRKKMILFFTNLKNCLYVSHRKKEVFSSFYINKVSTFFPHLSQYKPLVEMMSLHVSHRNMVDFSIFHRRTNKLLFPAQPQLSLIFFHNKMAFQYDFFLVLMSFLN